ncbi:MAG: hypothetical protein LBR40_02340 [Bacilli bacterium]|jgi:hypothetical protein|nr:hypothetical protein [Bacilli bacterium]
MMFDKTKMLLKGYVEEIPDYELSRWDKDQLINKIEWQNYINIQEYQLDDIEREISFNNFARAIDLIKSYLN